MDFMNAAMRLCIVSPFILIPTTLLTIHSAPLDTKHPYLESWALKLDARWLGNIIESDLTICHERTNAFSDRLAFKSDSNVSTYKLRTPFPYPPHPTLWKSLELIDCNATLVVRILMKSYDVVCWMEFIVWNCVKIFEVFKTIQLFLRMYTIPTHYDGCVSWIHQKMCLNDSVKLLSFFVRLHHKSIWMLCNVILGIKSLAFNVIKFDIFHLFRLMIHFGFSIIVDSSKIRSYSTMTLNGGYYTGQFNWFP